MGAVSCSVWSEVGVLTVSDDERSQLLALATSRSLPSRGCTSIRRTAPWCCVWMRRVRCRPSNARSRCCRWAWDTSKELHDYIRHGTTTLFAALEMAEGLLYGMCMKRHRHQEWIRFLKLLDEQTPGDYDLHLILDNYATHKHPKVKAWIARHPRFKLHFIPTSSSWLNLVERWFRDLTQKQLRRGTFRSVNQLRAAIQAYIDQHNEVPQPFVWTAKADEIIAKVKRARAALDKSPSV